jgi:hypothetical protein
MYRGAIARANMRPYITMPSRYAGTSAFLLCLWHICTSAVWTGQACDPPPRSGHSKLIIRRTAALRGKLPFQLSHSSRRSQTWRSILRWFTRSRSSAYENETADQFGMAYRKRLRDISSDREAQQIDLQKSECPDQIGGVLRHRIPNASSITWVAAT